MPDAFLDTSVLIRIATGDVPERQSAALRLFKRANDGEIRLVVPAIVVAEAVYVLTSQRLYGLSRARAAELLATLVSQDGVELENPSRVLRALSLFGAMNVDFEDALVVAAMEAVEATDIYSYDKDYDRFAGINRLEP